jgi:hypothetical protein
MKYVAIRMDGSRTIHESLVALNAAKRRARGLRTIVSSWREDDPPPPNNDAKGWDTYRTRHGCPSR